MNKRLSDLLNKYHQNKCTEEELHMLTQWFESIGERNDGLDPDQGKIEEIFLQIKQSSRFRRHWTMFRFSHVFYRSVAILLAFCLVGAFSIYYITSHRYKNEEVLVHEVIQPGRAQATLMLGDGRKFLLDHEKVGIVAIESGTEIFRDGQGEISYHADETDVHAEPTFNTLSTPRGGFYQMVLPDGSRAWLNASSSITYPVAFDRKERRVKITGEVYFEITQRLNAHKKPVPFWVETDKQRIEVLGTQFNVNTYKEFDAERTTLVEGKVKVLISSSGLSEFLKPNQQAKVSDQIELIESDVSRDIAWKNGDFVFRDEPLSSILHQIMLWYDVDIQCPERLGRIRFNGMVSRKQPLADVIHMINSTDQVKMVLKGRRIVVSE